MEFEIIDLNDVCEEQLISAISNNMKTASLMEAEIKKLKKFAVCSDGVEYFDEDLDDDNHEENIGCIDLDFEDEVDYYYQLLKGYKIEDLRKEITRILPSRHNYNYERILYRIKAEILKEIKEIKDYISSEGFDQGERDAFDEDLLYFRNVLDLLDEHLLPVEDASEEEIENKLIFFTTPSGNIQVFDSLESIDGEFYERFNELFTSIKNGTFKGVKRFSNHNALSGFCEVKGYQVRVVYARISYDTYAIVSAFVKKSDKDQAYSNYLVKHCRDYRSVESRLKERLDNPEFLQLNSEYEQELFRILGGSKGDKKKPLVKELRGDK